MGGARSADSRTSWPRTWISLRRTSTRRALLGLAARRRKAGLKAVDLFDAVERGSIKAVWIMSTNPVVTHARCRARTALERCGLVVVSDCVRDTDTTLRARAAAGRGVGREVGHRHELGAAHLAAANLLAASRRSAARLVDRRASGAAYGVRQRVRLTRRPRFSASTRLSAFENGGDARLRHRRRRALERRRVRRAATVPMAASGRRCGEPPRLFADGRFFTASRKRSSCRRRRAAGRAAERRLSARAQYGPRSRSVAR